MTLRLAIDTSTEEVAVGLGYVRPEGVHLIGETNLDVPRASLTHLVPAVMRLLQSADLAIGDLQAIVVGRGPGSFTGVRIGVSAAKGIAQGCGTPLYGVNTLDAIAERFAGREGLVGVIGDAMRREVYPALYRLADGGVERLTPDAVSAPAVVAEAWSAFGEPVLLAGNGLHKYADVFLEALGNTALFSPEALWTPTGESLLMASWREREHGRQGDGDVGAVLPVYTRLSDAEETENAGAARAAGGIGSHPSGVAGPGVGGGAL
jgi:N6-L-threonylcarbamoyladenine synthase